MVNQIEKILKTIIEKISETPKEEKDFRNYISDNLLKEKVEKLHMEEKFSYEDKKTNKTKKKYIDLFFVLNKKEVYIELKFDRKGDCNKDKRDIYLNKDCVILKKLKDKYKKSLCFGIFLSNVEADLKKFKGWSETQVNGLKFIINKI